MPAGGKRRPELPEPTMYATAEEGIRSKAAALLEDILTTRMEQAQRRDKLRRMGNRLRPPCRSFLAETARIDALIQRNDEEIRLMVDELALLLTNTQKIKPQEQLKLA